MAKAGYNPYGASRYQAELARPCRPLRSAVGRSGRPERVHDPPRDRRAGADGVAVGAPAEPPGVGEGGVGPAISPAIDGIAFGDSPSQGIVRGRSFYHTRLGFHVHGARGLLADERFGGGARGSDRARARHALRYRQIAPFDAARPVSQIRLGSRASNITDVKALDVGGLAAETGIAKSGELGRFRLAAIRNGNIVYRPSFAARSLTPEADRRFVGVHRQLPGAAVRARARR